MLSDVDKFIIAKRNGHFQFVGEYYLMLTLKDIRDGLLHLAYENLICAYNYLISETFTQRRNLLISVFGKADSEDLCNYINSIDSTKCRNFDLLKAFLCEYGINCFGRTEIINELKEIFKGVLIDSSLNHSSISQKNLELLLFFEYKVERRNLFVFNDNDIKISLNRRALEIAKNSRPNLLAFEFLLVLDSERIHSNSNMIFEVMDFIKKKPLSYHSLYLLQCRRELLREFNFVPRSLTCESLLLKSIFAKGFTPRISNCILDTLYFYEEIVVLVSDDDCGKFELMNGESFEIKNWSEYFDFSKISLSEELQNIEKFIDLYMDWFLNSEEEQKESDMYERLLDNYSNQGYRDAYEIDPPFNYGDENWYINPNSDNWND